MITLPPDLDFTAKEAAAEAKQACDRVDERAEILLGYLNQIRAANELGETSLMTTCMTHELNWLASELDARGFKTSIEVHLMHGQINIRWSEIEEEDGIDQLPRAEAYAA